MRVVSRGQRIIVLSTIATLTLWAAFYQQVSLLGPPEEFLAAEQDARHKQSVSTPTQEARPLTPSPTSYSQAYPQFDLCNELNDPVDNCDEVETEGCPWPWYQYTGMFEQLRIPKDRTPIDVSRGLLDSMRYTMAPVRIRLASTE